MTTFPETVCRQFQFLLDAFGYEVFACEADRVVFRRDALTVNVQRSPLEQLVLVDVENSGEGYSLYAILKVQRIQWEDRRPGEFTNDQEGYVSRLAASLRAYGERALQGDSSFYDLMNQSAMIEGAKYTKGGEYSTRRREATAAWNRGDYETVVRQYEAMEPMLADTERTRLETARGHLEQ